MLIVYNQPVLDCLGYDWYSISIEHDAEDFIFSYILKHDYYSDAIFLPSKGFNGFTNSYKVLDSDENVLITILYGGESQNNKINIFSSGKYAELFYLFLQDISIEYSLVRADICVDYKHEGCWDEYFSYCSDVADTFSIKKLFVGSPDSLVGDSPSGRTLYLGSRTSVSFIRLYEKGKKDNPFYPNWVRLELEFKPKNKQARLLYAKASKLDILNASAFVDVIFGKDFDVGKAPCPAGTIRSLPDYDRTLLHLFKQYGSFFDEGLSRHKGDLFAFFQEGKDIVDRFKFT